MHIRYNIIEDIITLSISLEGLFKVKNHIILKLCVVSTLFLNYPLKNSVSHSPRFCFQTLLENKLELERTKLETEKKRYVTLMEQLTEKVW